jgi:hypothetical protein
MGAYFMIPYWIVAIYPAALLRPCWSGRVISRFPWRRLREYICCICCMSQEGFSPLRALPDGTIWKSFLVASLPLVLIVKLVFVRR